jgi:hypothetical protein
MNMWVHASHLHLKILRIMVKMWHLGVKFSAHFPYFIQKETGLSHPQGCVHI